MARPRWKEGLEGSALRIAQVGNSPLRVLAGPGTGKTFALMRRIMRLLEEGVEPRRIMLCTFTRTAARDLQEEVSRLGVPGAEEVYAGTVHSFCFRLLSRAEVLPLTGRVPRPLLRFEERFMLEDLRRVNNEGIKDLEKRLLAFSAAWARLQSDTPGWPQDAKDRAFLNALDAWLRFHKGMLVGELVPTAFHFLRDNPASPHWPLFDHVLVDEYQDLNRAEQVLLDLIASRGTLTVVGDEDQSIYSFKHAHPEGIAEFGRTHPGTHDESLEQCRRCPRVVVDMANSLIAYNESRAQRVLKPYAGNPEGEVWVVQWPSVEEEAQGLATFVAQRVKAGGLHPGEVLVLAPRRQLGYRIRDELVALGVPAHSFFHEEALEGDPTSLDGSMAQQAFSLLTLLARPSDRVALRAWCGYGSQSLRAGGWRRIREYAEKTGRSPFNILADLAAGKLSLPYTSAVVDRFDELRQRLAELQHLSGVEIVDALFPPNESWAEPLRTITSVLKQDGGPRELLDLVYRAVTQPELPTTVDYVRVMSLHKSKGLTAKLVIVIGCIDGLIPSLPSNAPAPEAKRAIEEQRRLFYVALTRTKQTLVLSSATHLDAAEAHRMGAPGRYAGDNYIVTFTSRFLRELGPSCPAAILGKDFLQSAI